MTEYTKKRIFPKKETDFIRDFMDDFKKICGSKVWWFKTHGEPMQARGIPDILMCYSGLFIGIEFKIMRQGKLNVSPYQEYNIDLINKASGFGLVVWYDESNQECGINIKRFEDRKTCVRFFADLLVKYCKLPPCNYATIREGENIKSSS
jgi:hypothetical protein